MATTVDLFYHFPDKIMIEAYLDNQKDTRDYRSLGINHLIATVFEFKILDLIGIHRQIIETLSPYFNNYKVSKIHEARICKIIAKTLENAVQI